VKKTAAAAERVTDGGGALQLERGRSVRRLDQFTVVDAQASYRFGENIDVQGGINNLFDSNYSFFECYREAGRNLFANVGYLS
jgi:outer membrane receptor protein involved in Fe transport